MSKEFMHTTKDGKKIKLSDLGESHLKKIINVIEQKAKVGLTIQYGSGTDPDSFDYERNVIYGDDVLSLMNYYQYVFELGRRAVTAKFTDGDWILDEDNEIVSDAGGVLRIAEVSPVGSKEEQRANGWIMALGPVMYNAIKEFCDRVEKGEVRSTHTYKKFKEIINRINSLK